MALHVLLTRGCILWRRMTCVLSARLKATYLKDPSSAAAAARIFRPHICRPEAVVYECHPGSGIFTKALLDIGVKHLVVWDDPENCPDAFKKIQKEYPGRLIYHPHLYQKKNRLEAIEYDEHLTDHRLFVRKDHEVQPWQPPKSVHWKDEPQLHLITWMTEHNLNRFISSLASDINSMRPPFNWGRPSIYCSVSKANYQRLVNRYSAVPAVVNNLPARSKLVELIFDTETLISNEESFSVIKLTPKIDLFEEVCSREDWDMFYDFFRMLHSNRFKRFIPWLEQVFPGFGEELIEMDFTMMQQGTSIHVSHIPAIFKVLRKKYHALL